MMKFLFIDNRKGIKYKGKIVSAIDGTQVKLPYTAKLKEHFGTSGQGGKAVTGRCSIKYDVLGDVIMDACFDRSMLVKERRQRKCFRAGRFGTQQKSLLSLTEAIIRVK